MPLPSFFQRFSRKSSSGQGASDAVPLTPSDVEATRARARRRLVGMVVLVGAGVIGFPWLFETQPRSMSPDVQIVQGASEGGDVQISGVAPARSPRSVAGRVAVSNIVEPSAPTAVQEEPAPATAAGQRRAEPVEQVVDEPVPRAAASRPAEAPKAVAKPASKPVEKQADKPAARPQVKDAAKDSAKDSAKDKAKDAPKVAAKDKDGSKPASGKDAPKASAKEVAKAPAKADKPADKPADKDKTSTRYVVQFGAFADVNTAHEARMKVERLGLKTYTQQVDTPAGKRIRVRMGPYADKAEADKAMATMRKAGLTGAILTL
ncbi:SPOR domain-containing protein [Aquabacterium sp.]|uniref:SPOR domain-containing protein n=1 Tax=Aquabacterium sp. TaxID=1872578 RepID=UPI0025BDC175|nr:SPOR domain-containing protein [Aquabacterium sp.]